MCCYVSSYVWVHLAMKGVSTLVVKGSDCTCSYKSNYNTNMTTTALLKRNLKHNSYVCE
jgi:hypothetical protein